MMNQRKLDLKRIAVGVDGSTASLAALSWATRLAADAGTGVEVAAYMSWNYPTSLLLPVFGAPVLPADAMADAARIALGEVVDGHPDGALVTELHTPMGSARSVLTDATADHDLLVVGRTGRGRFERLLLGSTASHVARHAHCPVLLVDDDHVSESLTVAVDGSDHAIGALAWALGLPGDRPVLAVYSHDESLLDDLPLSSEDRETFDNAAEQLLHHTVEEAAHIAGVDVDSIATEVRSGDPRTSVVETADPESLLVMGARGHSGLSGWVLGSLADFAIHHSPSPLLLWNSV